MSKKNRQKKIKAEGIVRRGTFSVEDSKVFIIATIVMFHIVPLFFVMMGENGQALLLQFFLLMLNPMFIALTGLIYGIKKGFDFKFPLFLAVVSAVSIPMYYKFETAQLLIQSSIIMTIVHFIFAYLSTAIGGFFKKLLNL